MFYLQNTPTIQLNSKFAFKISIKFTLVGISNTVLHACALTAINLRSIKYWVKKYVDFTVCLIYSPTTKEFVRQYV